MAETWDVSISGPASPLQYTGSSEDGPQSRIYRFLDETSSSSSAETPGVRSFEDAPSSTLNLTFDDFQSGANSISSDVEDELTSIRHFCDNISNNLNAIGISIDNPRNLPVAIVEPPVEFIDLCNDVIDSPPPRSARAMVPEAIIDLCTPDTSHRVNRAASANRISRRRVMRNSLPDLTNENTYNNNNNQAEQLVSPPKKQKQDKAKNKDMENSSTAEDPYKCPVCLDNVRKRAPTSTKCGHIFCKACIETAIKSTHKCPLCNLKITAKSIFRIYL